MSPGALLTNERSKRHIEMSALLLATVDTIGVKGIFRNKLLNQLGLFGRLALEHGSGRW